MRKNLALLAITLLILFFLAELVLRVAFDLHPGEAIHAPYFTPVSELKLKQGVTADSLGIQIVDSTAARVIADRIQTFYATGNLIEANDTEADVYELIRQVALTEDTGFHSPLKSHIHSAGFPATELDSAILFYLRHPVNDHGFRSIPFRNYKGTKKKVLLLGDSFTWGHTASNRFLSFADNLLAKGYAVYNSGMTCTDPVQYHQVAEKYIPLLAPDVVIMNVYLGNDVQYYSRLPTPFVPQVYCTNAGFLRTDFNGITIANPDSAYHIVDDNIKIPVDNSAFARLCSYTSVGTLIWKVCVKLQMVRTYSDKYSSIWATYAERKLPKPDVNQRVRMVQKICDEHGAKLIVSVIPFMNDLRMLKGADHYPGFLDSIPYYLSPVKTAGYQFDADGHFNDKGHAEYAAFLDSLMRVQ